MECVKVKVNVCSKEDLLSVYGVGPKVAKVILGRRNDGMFISRDWMASRFPKLVNSFDYEVVDWRVMDDPRGSPGVQEVGSRTHTSQVQSGLLRAGGLENDVGSASGMLLVSPRSCEQDGEIGESSHSQRMVDPLRTHPEDGKENPHRCLVRR